MGSAGSSKTKTEASSFNMADAMSLASSLNTSNAESVNASDQASASRTFVDKAQQPFLSRLYSMGQGAAGMDTGAEGVNKSTMGGLLSDFKGLGALSDVGGNIASGTKALSSGLRDTFAKTIMPGIKSNALASGGFGGGRQGVAEGTAAGGIASAFTQGLADIRERAQAMALQGSTARSGLAAGMTAQAAAPAQQRMQQLLQYAGLLGGPTVLSEGTSSGTTRGTSSSTARGSSSSTSFNRSRGTMQSGGKGSSWNFGIS